MVRLEILQDLKRLQSEFFTPSIVDSFKAGALVRPLSDVRFANTSNLSLVTEESCFRSLPAKQALFRHLHDQV
jgi:hypothetical protein